MPDLECNVHPRMRTPITNLDRALASGTDCKFCCTVQSSYQALRLCLVTQCKRGSAAPPRRNASLVCELGRQEPPHQCVPRQSRRAWERVEGSSAATR